MFSRRYQFHEFERLITPGREISYFGLEEANKSASGPEEPDGRIFCSSRHRPRLGDQLRPGCAGLA